MIATWVGGPFDGQEVEVDGESIRVIVAADNIPWTSDPLSISFNTRTFPIYHHPHGNRIYWNEGRKDNG